MLTGTLCRPARSNDVELYAPAEAAEPAVPTLAGAHRITPSPLIELIRPALPPLWGPLAKVAATAANRPLRGRLGPGAGPTVRLVAHSVRPELAYPPRYSARRSGDAQG